MMTAYACLECGDPIHDREDICGRCSTSPERASASLLDPWEIASGLDPRKLEETRAYRQSKFRRAA